LKHVKPMKEMLVKNIQDHYENNSNVLKNVQEQEIYLFRSIRSLESNCIKEIHNEQLRLQKEMKELELSQAHEMWQSQQKRLIHIFEKNANLSKHIPELIQELDKKNNLEKKSLLQEQEHQTKTLESMLHKESERFSQIEQDWMGQLNNHHRNERQTLLNQREKTQIEVEMMIKRIISLFKPILGFSRFCSKEVELEINDILEEESKALDDLELKIEKTDKRELFVCSLSVFYS